MKLLLAAVISGLVFGIIGFVSGLVGGVALVGWALEFVDGRPTRGYRRVARQQMARSMERR